MISCIRVRLFVVKNQKLGQDRLGVKGLNWAITTLRSNFPTHLLFMEPRGRVFALSVCRSNFYRER